MEGEQTYSMPQAINFVWEQDGDYVRIDEWCRHLNRSVDDFLTHYGTQIAFRRFQGVIKEELYKKILVSQTTATTDDMPPLEDETNAPEGWTCEEGDEGEEEGDEGEDVENNNEPVAGGGICGTCNDSVAELVDSPTKETVYVHKYILPIILMFLKNTELGELTDKMCPSHLIISCKANSLHIRVYDGWFNASLLAKSMNRDLGLFIQNELPKYETLGQLTQEMGMVRGSIEKDLWCAPSMFFPFLAWCDPVVFADFTGRYLLTGVKHPNTDVFRAMLDVEL